jgi:hypothetical protein
MYVAVLVLHPTLLQNDGKILSCKEFPDFYIPKLDSAFICLKFSTLQEGIIFHSCTCSCLCLMFVIDDEENFLIDDVIWVILQGVTQPEDTTQYLLCIPNIVVFVCTEELQLFDVMVNIKRNTSSYLNRDKG